MAGWRGSSGAPIIVQGSGKKVLRPAPHGYGGVLGLNLSPNLLQQPTDKESGTPNVSNTATLPVRGNVVVPWMKYPNGMPGETGKPPTGVPGQVVSGAYGNPAHASQSALKTGGNWGGRFENVEAPGSKNLGASGQPTAGGEAALHQVQPFPHVSALGVGQETAWRGGVFFANDRLEAYERYGLLSTGSERGGGRGSGQTDPPMDGPARPILKLVNRVINWQVGNPLAHQDQDEGENRDYHKVPPVKPWSDSAKIGGSYALKNQVTEPGPQFVGEQGTGWAPVYGGVPGLWQPYGSYAGYAAGPVTGIQSPAPEGTPADGPQLVFSGLPHGLHSLTYPDYSSTLGRYMAIAQMTAPRQDRPSNSPIAGQAYNQYVMPQGQTGTAAVRTGTAQQPIQGALASQSWRNASFPQGGWRGIRPGGGQA